MRGRAKKDGNHALIVETIKKLGGGVLDLSQLGQGVPDLAVLTRKGIQLAEIKNPENKRYAKSLSALQTEWATNWRGAPVYILRTVEDARLLVIGDFEKLDAVGGGH